MEHDQAAFAAGCEAARGDVSAGKLVYRWSGHAGHWGHWIATQLSERFGAGVDGLGFCFVTASGVSFNDRYNSILIEEIDRRHGSGAFQSLLTESREQSEESLRDAKQTWLVRNSHTEPGDPVDRNGR